MKTRPALLASMTFVAVILAAPQLQGQQADVGKEANAAYFEAVAYETAGNAEAAKLSYEKALRLNPRHANARYRLGQLKVNYDQIISKGQERKIGTVMIPEFKVEDADFSEALKALAIHVEKQTKEEVSPNFIIQDPSNTIASRKVTLQLKNMPSGEILNYMLSMAKAKARYDKHAVVILPH